MTCTTVNVQNKRTVINAGNGPRSAALPLQPKTAILTGCGSTPGVRGAAGPTGGIVAGTAATALSGHRAVYQASDGLRYASSDAASTADAVVGITTAAALAGDTVQVRHAGELAFPAGTFTPEDPVFLGLDGQITQAPATAGTHLELGVATTSATVQVRIQFPILLAGA